MPGVSRDNPLEVNVTRSLVALSLLGFAVVAVPSWADQPAAQASAEQPAAKESAAVTHHSIRLDGHTIRYTATAGNLILKDDKGKPTASVFYIAFTKDGAASDKRPVTFAYNGGPGGSSVLVDLGGFGPMRVVTTDAAPTPPAPYTLKDNPYSLLDKTDLVFIDAVGTGFSHTLGKATGKDFYGADQDAKAFGEFIERYITVNNRWNSPKFLLGESYGTPRSAMLADWLQENGVAVNGVVLLSSILNFNDEFWFQPPGSSDLPYELYLPSYAAIAWYHKKVPHKLDLPAFVQQVREFALGGYATALAKGDSLPAAERDHVAQQLQDFTGIDKQYWLNADLRVTPSRFEKELLRDQHRIIGRYDGRFEGVDHDAAGEFPGFDPSSSAMFPAVVATFHDYLINDLDYHNPANYEFLSYKVNSSWDWHHSVDRSDYPVPDTLPDLRDAMTKNPHLMVFSGNGYFDLATPFFKTEYELNHMNLAPELRKNIVFGYYHSGHMLYIHNAALKKLKADLAKFYDRAAAE